MYWHGLGYKEYKLFSTHQSPLTATDRLDHQATLPPATRPLRVVAAEMLREPNGDLTRRVSEGAEHPVPVGLSSFTQTMLPV